MHRLVVAVVFALIVAMAASDADANRTKNCSEEAQANIELAVRFIDNNMGKLKNPPNISFGRRGQRRRIHRKMDRKLHKLRFGCKAGVLCPVNGTKNGHAMWLSMGHKVRLCYDSMKERPKYGYRTYQFCELVGVIAHEFGHTVGIPKDPFAKHGKNRNDRVYQFGDFAEKLCKDAGLQRPLEAIPVSRRWKRRW